MKQSVFTARRYSSLKSLVFGYQRERALTSILAKIGIDGGNSHGGGHHHGMGNGVFDECPKRHWRNQQKKITVQYLHGYTVRGKVLSSYLLNYNTSKWEKSKCFFI